MLGKLFKIIVLYVFGACAYAGLAPTSSIVLPTDLSIHRLSEIEITFSTKLISILGKAAKSNKAFFSIVRGGGRLRSSELKSDDRGLVENTYYHDGVNEDQVLIRIKSGVTTEYLTINIKHPVPYTGTISFENSRLYSQSYTELANGSNQTQITLEIRDEQSKIIEQAYGLRPRLVCDSNTLGEFVISDPGVYSYNFDFGDEQRSYNCSAKFRDGIIRLDSNLDSIPLIDPHSLDMSSLGTIGSEVTIAFTLKDEFSHDLRSTHGLNFSINSSVGGTFSGVTFDGGKFITTFYPPQGAGTGEVELVVNGTLMLSRPSISYENIQIDFRKSKISIDNPKFNPYVETFKTIRIELIDVEGNPVARLGSRVVLSGTVDGAGELDEFSIREGLIEVNYHPRFFEYQSTLTLYAGADQIGDSIEIQTDLSPERDDILNLRYFSGLQGDFIQFSRVEEKIIGFLFKNSGPNKIMPHHLRAPDETKDDFTPHRLFNFSFLDRARQNLVLWISDSPTHLNSSNMESTFTFFPRLKLPQLEQGDDELTITLPTKEKVVINKNGEIISGVLEEGPIDMLSSKLQRKFPTIRYKGAGIVIRANRRSNAPSFEKWNGTDVGGDFGNSGEEFAYIYYYDFESDTPVVCTRRKSELWVQEDIRPIPFKFKTDQLFYDYLEKNCQWDVSEILKDSFEEKETILDVISNLLPSFDDDDDEEAVADPTPEADPTPAPTLWESIMEGIGDQ
ncbi:MAG: hypothetical protein HOE90_23845 [Bacteriovoracaceae bacterium]|jgi:hypothetical protein|nr:hypothetical protein [Bacteriovoracaceae bacterium]